MIKADHPDLEFVWRNLILTKQPDGGDPVDDGLTLEELGQDQLFGTFPTEMTVEFRSGEQKWQQTFGPTATVLDARKFASEKTGCQDLSNIQLFYAGRELRDSQALSRLRMKPGNFITIVADMDETFLVQSVRSLRLPPIQYKFHRTDTQEEFTLALLGADMADRARVMAAAHCGVSNDALSLWFNGREILDDVMMDLIGLNPAIDSIDVDVQDKEDLTTSRMIRFDPLQASMLLMASQLGKTDQNAEEGDADMGSSAVTSLGLRALTQGFRSASQAEVVQALVQSRQNITKAADILEDRAAEEEADRQAGDTP
jgi:hypothetical protein